MVFKRWLIFAAAFFLVSLAALAWLYFERESRVAFTTPEGPSDLAVVVEPGGKTCRRQLHSVAAFDGIQLKLGTFFKPGSRLAVTVRDSASSRLLSVGLLASGYADNSFQTVGLKTPVSKGTVDLCIQNLGAGKTALYGAGEERDGETVPSNGLSSRFYASFYRTDRLKGVQLPKTVFARAEFFHPGWVRAWTFWLLFGLLLLGVPLLLAYSLTCHSRVPSDRPKG